MFDIFEIIDAHNKINTIKCGEVKVVINNWENLNFIKDNIVSINNEIKNIDIEGIYTPLDEKFKIDIDTIKGHKKLKYSQQEALTNLIKKDWVDIRIKELSLEINRNATITIKLKLFDKDKIIINQYSKNISFNYDEEIVELSGVIGLFSKKIVNKIYEDKLVKIKKIVDKYNSLFKTEYKELLYIKKENINKHIYH